ncbi:hypothetical protein ABZ135_23680 [Streptomyces sp. NPDC006339]|uniref:hypothetical protein n=1 Tax=Streptomyces sp. NPDC006339 TaxID=3156755 RepID=UPI0033A2C47D
MNTFVRRTTAALTEAADTVTMLIGAATGAWTGYTYSPAGLDAALHLPYTGAAALAGALVFSAAADLVLIPVRRRLALSAPLYTPAAGGRGVRVPADLDEALGQIGAATETDAAHRAAQAAYRIDLSKSLLSSADRWRGYTTGDATFYLAPGAVLHHSREEDEYGVPQHRYTLLTAEDPTSVPITNIGQIHQDLAPRARKTTEAANETAPSTV